MPHGSWASCCCEQGGEVLDHSQEALWARRLSSRLHYLLRNIHSLYKAYIMRASSPPSAPGTAGAPQVSERDGRKSAQVRR